MTAVFILLGCNMLSQKALAEAKSLKGSRPNTIFVLTDDQGVDDLASEYPEVVDQLRKSYDQWWELVLPLMVNEGLPKVENHPLHIRYNIQLKETGIPEWAP